MTKALTKLNPDSASPIIATEYLPPANSIDERAERVGSYYHSGRRAAAQLVVYNVLAGIELIGIKEQIAHGEFTKWCEKHLPEGMSHRSANYFMGLAEALIPKIAALNCGRPGEGFNFKQLQIANGELNDKEIRPFAEAVQEVTNGKAYTDLLREYGLMADPKHQKDRAQSPASKPTAEDAAEAARRFMDQVAADITTLIKPGVHDKHLTRDDIKFFYDEKICAASKWARDLIKSRRSQKVGTVPARQGPPRAPSGMSKKQRAEIAKRAEARWAKLRAKKEQE